MVPRDESLANQYKSPQLGKPSANTPTPALCMQIYARIHKRIQIISQITFSPGETNPNEGQTERNEYRNRFPCAATSHAVVEVRL